MLATASSLDTIQADLRRRHARVRNLRLSDGANGLAIDGETSTFHAVQLLIRDVVALDLAPRVQVRVAVNGPPATGDTPADPAPPRTPRPADVIAGRVLIAGVDRDLLARCADRLARAGYLVTLATTGLECLRELVSRRLDQLVLVGRLPWGGSNGVLHLAHEEGYLDRMTVAYMGGADGLDDLSGALLGKLSSVRLTAECDEDAVCRTVTAGRCACAR